MDPRIRPLVDLYVEKVRHRMGVEDVLPKIDQEMVKAQQEIGLPKSQFSKALREALAEVLTADELRFAGASDDSVKASLTRPRRG